MQETPKTRSTLVYFDLTVGLVLTVIVVLLLRTFSAEQVRAVAITLALIGTAALVMFAGRRIAAPVAPPSSTDHSVSESDLVPQPEVKTEDSAQVSGQLSDNDTADSLQDTIVSLEGRMVERVRDLSLAAEVSRQITTELDSAQLLSRVAELVVAAFDLYHVSIYLYNETDQVIRLRQGLGSAGQMMVAEGQHFHITGLGIVPQAARSQQATIANDVLQDDNYLPNPLLIETRSETAVPMLFQGKLVGVLDLQSTAVNRFRLEDVRIMQTLADQIAVAMRNSQLFEEVNAAFKEAERANSVKSAFLASMSHELRTPLNAIINFTRFVAKGAMGPVNAEQEETLNEVIDSAKHLLNLINDVLDMSKIEAGSLKLFVEDDVDLNPILKTVITTGKSLIGDKSVELQVDIADDLPRIRGDRQRIIQILLNIVSNACKFTQEGHIKVRACRETEEVLFAVEDTGPGIAPEDQAAVFEAFKQTSTGLRQAGGTGLGMPISKNLVEAHNGRLWLESEPGKGSTFYVALPLKSDSLIPSVVA